MFRTLLIANRGEIACRIVRTARRLGLRTIAVYSDADAHGLHTRAADVAVRLGPASARESYLSIEALLRAARESGAEAIHPGYGFLSQSAEFAEACARAGVTFVGPPAAAMRAMGVKDESKALMQKAGVPVVPGYLGETQDEERLAAEAARIGFPVLIKAIAGGGGKGMRIVRSAGEFAAALAAARGEAERAFGNPRVMLERYVEDARHVEVQVIADAHGNTLHLFERDCSLQRRYQKIIEEAPAPLLSAGLRSRLLEAAVAAARAVRYQNAGTVEFVVGGKEFYFLEMNTRLQVEHPVTEAILGIDLVEWQLRIAAGEPLARAQEQLRPQGHAFEARIYAEDPRQGFLPSGGRITELHWPAGVRVDTGVEQGDRVVTDYDALLAKIIVHGADRDAARRSLVHALRECSIDGVRTNLAALLALAQDEEVAAARATTRLIDARGAALLPAAGAQAERARALAAVALVAQPGVPAHRCPQRCSPWALNDAWRSGAAVRPIVRLQAEGHVAHRLELEALELGWRVLDGAVPPVHEREPDRPLPAPAGHVVAHFETDGDRGRAWLDGCETAFRAVRLRDRVAVWLDGEWHRFSRVASPRAGASGAGDALLRAPMPGMVLALHVQAGQPVRRGQPLAVLEAMKMEHTLNASQDGTISRIDVQAGQRVREGDPLLELHSEPVAGDD